MGTSSSKSAKDGVAKPPSLQESMSSAFSSKSKSEPRTGTKVTALKLETAAKTGVLALSGHGLKAVPAGVWAIEKMTTLDLANNKLTTLGGGGGVAALRMLKTSRSTATS